MKNNKVISFVLVLMLVLSSVVFVHADTQAIVHTSGAISDYIDDIEMNTTTGGPINTYGFDSNPAKNTWKTVEDYDETTETIISLDIHYSFGYTHVITKQELIDAGIIGTEGKGSINFHLYDEIPFPYEEFSIEVEKVADMYDAQVGDEITYTVTVTNTNDYDLPDVEVIDSMFGTLISDHYLVSHGSIEFIMTAMAIEEGTMTNIVTASSLHGEVYDSDMVEVMVTEPMYGIQIMKVADKEMAYVGDVITYTITVENTGDQDLDDVWVEDSMFGWLVTDAALMAGYDMEFVMTKEAMSVGEMYNIATASAMDGDLMDYDDATVDVMTRPSYGIEIMKVADPTSVYVGEDITYTVTVYNTGNQDLTDVWVEDSMFGWLVTDASIMAGYDMEFVMTKEAMYVGEMYNIATASAMGGQYMDSDDATVDVMTPPAYGIEVMKVASPTSVYVGDEIEYTVTVYNTGNQDFTDVWVEDSMFGWLATDASIMAGQHMEFVMTKEAMSAGQMHNIATASAMGGQYMDSDDATVDVMVVPTYGIEVMKVADPTSVYVGDDITYTVTVTNTGNQNLTDVWVEDSMFGWLVTDASIMAGYDMEFVMTKEAMSVGQMYNIATASAMGGQYMDDDDATVDVMARPTYGIDVMKVANPTMPAMGETVTYTVTVTNVGSEDLDDVWVEDSMFGWLLTDGALMAGEDMMFEMTSSAVVGTTINIVTASAMQNDFVDTDSATVWVEPDYSLDVSKTVNDSSVYINDTVIYTVVVMNTGNMPLYSLTLYDYDGYDISTERAISMLTPGAYEEFEFSTSYSSTGQKTNVAEVHYWTHDEDEHWTSDTAIVDVSRRSTPRTDYEMTIEKEADVAEVLVGDTITYTITVTNTGDGTLTNVEVEDPMVGLDETIDFLFIGSPVEFTVEYTASEEGVLENTATATDDRAGVEEDTAIVIVNGGTPLGSPQMSIDKAFVPAMNQMYMPGNEFEFTITVMNTGSETLTNILVQDSMANFETTIPMLAPGESQMFTVMVTIPEGYQGEMFENVATATSNQTGTIQDEVTLFFDEEVPLGIPDTGVMPLSPFVGLGAAVLAASLALFKKKED